MDTTDIRDLWAERSGAYSPDYYAHHGPDEASEALRDALDSRVARDDAVLELGCSSGRHLAHLREGGFENLHGVDINRDAFAVMDDAYPELAAEGTFYVDAIEDVVPEFETGRFDAVYSVETLQHVHPDAAWVFEDLARITDDVLITVENEDGTDGDASGGDDAADVNYVNGDVPLYYRDWERVFGEFGLEQVDERSTRRDTMRTFRAA